MLSNTDQLISTLLVGNNTVNILASSLSTAIAIDIFGDKGLQDLRTGIVTLLILIFSEITPKSLASRFADGIALSFGGIISVLITLFKPVVVVLNFISGIIIRLLGGQYQPAPKITEEDLKTFVTVGHEAGVLKRRKRNDSQCI